MRISVRKDPERGHIFCLEQLANDFLSLLSSYGLFKSADKKLFKNENLAAELGRPEKLVEM